MHLAKTTFDAKLIDDVSAMVCKGDGFRRANTQTLEAFITFFLIKLYKLHGVILWCKSFMNPSAVSGEIEKDSEVSTRTETASEHLPKQNADLSSIA